MTLGYTLITVSSDKEKHVLDEVSALKGVKEAHLLVGEFDIITKLEADCPEDLASTVVDYIRTIEGVIYTKTLCTISTNYLRKK